jgi:hypothetical protein
VFQTAIIAGIMAAKKTGELIPLCHPLGLENCKINIHMNQQQELVIDCTASITAKTGVEMEALVGASIAALTIYDMCKALSHDIVIRETKLMKKREARVSSKDHKKHSDISRPSLGNFGRNEFAIVSTTCNNVRALAEEVIKALSTKYKCAYIDAEHKEKDFAETQNAFITYMDKISFKEFQLKKSLINFSITNYLMNQI